MITYGDCWGMEIIETTIPALYRKGTKPLKTGTERLKFSDRDSPVPNLFSYQIQLHVFCIYCCKCEAALRQESMVPPDYLLSSKDSRPVLGSIPSFNLSQLPYHCSSLHLWQKFWKSGPWVIWPSILFTSHSLQVGEKKALKRALSEAIFLIKYLLNTLV